MALSRNLVDVNAGIEWAVMNDSGIVFDVLVNESRRSVAEYRINDLAGSNAVHRWISCATFDALKFVIFAGSKENDQSGEN